ncbi:hypothetical protein ACIQ9P_38250 [Kitasatospora sp. NPDC094019]|uniref:hypothetical protein n=1 Tax=Kitasatospora sp. NPDC094019 TaxID=3364091 RepID=UPI0037F87CA7
MTADSTTHRTSPDADLLAHLLRAAVALDSYPSGTGRLAVESVDTVARSITRLSHDAPPGSVFHHVRDIPADAPYTALQRAGYPLLPLPEAHWYQQVHLGADHPDIHPAAVLAHLLGATDRTAPHLPVLDTTTTYTALHPGDVRPPNLDTPYFDHLVAGLVQHHILPPPPDR